MRRPHEPALPAELVPIIALTLASLVTILFIVARHVAPALVDLEHFAADYRTAYLADTASAQHDKIALVLVDEVALATFAGHNYRSPTDRGVLADLVAIIDQAQPLAIGLDYIFDRPTEAEKDTRLLAALRAAESRIVLGAADERVDLTAEQRAWQTRFLDASGREVGHLSLTYDRDQTVRYLSRPAKDGAYPASFAEQLAAGIPPPSVAAHRPPVLPMTKGDHRQHRIAWLRVDDQDPEAAFRVIPALPLLEAARSGDAALLATLSGFMRERVVIVGGDFPDMDRHDTPLRVLGADRLRGAVLHAHMVAQLIDRRTVTHAPRWIEPLLCVILALGGFWAGYLWRVERFVYPSGVALLIVCDALVFLGSRMILPFTLPLFALLAGAWFGRNFDLLQRGFERRAAMRAAKRPRRPPSVRTGCS